MQHDPRNTRRKLFASLAVLTVVFTVAAIAQFTGTSQMIRRNQSCRKPIMLPRISRERSFGEVSPAITAAPAPDVQQAEPKEEIARSRTETAASPGRGQIEGLLDRWRDTFARGDVNGQTILYAPKMESFLSKEWSFAGNGTAGKIAHDGVVSQSAPVRYLGCEVRIPET